MVITVFVQMDRNGMTFTARYNDQKINGRPVHMTGTLKVKRKPGTAAMRPGKQISKILSELESETLVKFLELKDSGAFTEK